MTRAIRALFVAIPLMFMLAAECTPAPDPANPPGLWQGWTQAQRVAWYTASQGSRLIPRVWLHALEQPDAAAPFLDPAYIANFRYLPNPTAGFTSPDACPYDPALPLGFPVDCQSDTGFANTKLRWKADQSDSEPWVGMNCAACHTAEMTFKGSRIRADGGPTLADFQSFTEAMETALRNTASDPAKFNRFANKVLGANASAVDTGLLITALGSLNDWNKKLAQLNDTGGLRYGFGRLDAIGHIYNKVALLATPASIAHQTANPSDAPVSYPFLWNVPQLNKVEWNGIAPNVDLRDLRAGALVRNTGEVIGVFADVTIKSKPSLLEGYVSSINLPNLTAMETQLTTLLAPKWPDAFPAIKPDLARAGGALFAAKCAGCHTVPSSPGNLTEKYKVTLQPVFAGSDPANTDMWMACNALLDSAASGRFKGNSTEFFGTATIPDPADSFTLTQNAALGSIIGKKGDLVASAVAGIFDYAKGLPLPGQALFAVGLTPKQVRAAKCKAFKDDPANPKMVYKGRPLQGVWATAPYLHNGSVANLWELLLPPERRKKEFYTGTREFNPDLVGYETDPSAPGNSFLFRTRDASGAPIEGNANSGHVYGNAAMQESDRQALIEYMKTL
jgi:mono/diheme cytochrome c family protein